MTLNVIARPDRGLSWSTLASVLLLLVALSGLALLRTQIEVFGLQVNWPDARSFPAAALALLALSTLARIVLNRFHSEGGLGSAKSLGRVAGLFAVIVVSLWIMPIAGFFVGAMCAAIGTSLALGETRLIHALALAIVAAAFVTLVAKFGLRMPLP